MRIKALCIGGLNDGRWLDFDARKLIVSLPARARATVEWTEGNVVALWPPVEHYYPHVIVVDGEEFTVLLPTAGPPAASAIWRVLLDGYRSTSDVVSGR